MAPGAGSRAGPAGAGAGGGGVPVREAAERFQVSPSYVVKVRARSDAAPDATVAELRAWAEAGHGIRVSHPVMWRVLARLGQTRKKSGCAPPSRTGPT